MELIDLKNTLKRDNPNELYDISKLSFSYRRDLLSANFQIYIVSEFEEMRMDIICDSIYKKTDYVDFLCNLNNIFNPLSVKSGDEILYVDENLIPQFRPERSENDDIRKQISNKRKQSKVDPVRTKFKEDKVDSLPPTITKKDYNPVKYKDGKISIGEDIFNV